VFDDQRAIAIELQLEPPLGAVGEVIDELRRHGGDEGRVSSGRCLVVRWFVAGSGHVKGRCLQSLRCARARYLTGGRSTAVTETSTPPLCRRRAASGAGTKG